jgi:hypothetical protein
VKPYSELVHDFQYQQQSQSDKHSQDYDDLEEHLKLRFSGLL